MTEALGVKRDPDPHSPSEPELHRAELTGSSHRGVTVPGHKMAPSSCCVQDNSDVSHLPSKQHCRNVPLQVKVLHSKPFYSSVWAVVHSSQTRAFFIFWFISVVIIQCDSQNAELKIKKRQITVSRTELCCHSRNCRKYFYISSW